jgi:outer membrane protein OmpA-like peptidoglycan-associated protein
MKKLAVITVASLAMTACVTTDPYTGQQKASNTALGTGIGAAAGALGGLIVGEATGADTRKSVLLGAGIGALTGGGIGLYMDQQEAELRAQLQGSGVSVTRVGDNIVLNMPSNVTFDTDQDTIKPEFHKVLSSVSLVLKKFNRTLVDVYGHTDSDGSDEYNYGLSQRRATSVADFLTFSGIDSRRFVIRGYGKSQPIASNATAAGKAANRRVEIQITPLTGA